MLIRCDSLVQPSCRAQPAQLKVPASRSPSRSARSNRIGECSQDLGNANGGLISMQWLDGCRVHPGIVACVSGLVSWEWDDWLASRGRNRGKLDTLIKDDKDGVYTGSCFVSFHYSNNIITILISASYTIIYYYNFVLMCFPIDDWVIWGGDWERYRWENLQTHHLFSKHESNADESFFRTFNPKSKKSSSFFSMLFSACFLHHHLHLHHHHLHHHHPPYPCISHPYPMTSCRSRCGPHDLDRATAKCVASCPAWPLALTLRRSMGVRSALVTWGPRQLETEPIINRYTWYIMVFNCIIDRTMINNASIYLI